MLDDALLVHDYLFPKYLHIPEMYTYGGYTLIVAGYLIFFRRQILLTDYLLLLLAFIGLGFSVILDTSLPFSHLETFVEDSFKFLGIVFWLGYLTHTVVLNGHP
jgi:ABC-type polysaccharide/polyol phosphate export permease